MKTINGVIKSKNNGEETDYIYQQLMNRMLESVSKRVDIELMTSWMLEDHPNMSKSHVNVPKTILSQI